MWKIGTLEIGSSIFYYEMKQFEEGSHYGIDGGRISKLDIRRGGKTVCRYDRGWEMKPADHDTQSALETLLSENK